jgi:hypothetical protein
VRAGSSQNARDALMAVPRAFRLYCLGDGPQRLSFSPQRRDFTDRLLLGLMWDKFAVVATPETKGNFPAEIAAARLLVGFHLGNTLAELRQLDESRASLLCQSGDHAPLLDRLGGVEAVL